jgi:hypothetical protein
MIFWFAALIVIYITYLLLVKGFLWKLILFFAGWVGVYIILRTYFPTSGHIAMSFSGTTYSWAAVIPTCICILALATTRE